MANAIYTMNDSSLWTFMAAGHVTTLPHDCSGSIAFLSTIWWLWINTFSCPYLYTTDCLTTDTPLAPFTPATINLKKKMEKDRIILQYTCTYYYSTYQVLNFIFVSCFLFTNNIFISFKAPIQWVNEWLNEWGNEWVNEWVNQSGSNQYRVNYPLTGHKSILTVFRLISKFHLPCGWC